jgi:hypothetical protein
MRATEWLWPKEVDKMTTPMIAGAKLHVRIALLILALLAGSSALAASRYADAAQRLDGEWRGAEVVLKIDAERAQASMTPDRPFEWRRFIIKDIGPNEIVFAIGSELYEAKIDADTLTLTGTTFRGAKVLFRDDGLRGTTSE